jgi:hypothetical protein
VAIDGKEKSDNIAFMVVDKLHCAEREKRRLQRRATGTGQPKL